MQETPNFLSENPVSKTAEAKKESANAFILSIVALVIVLVFSGAMFALKLQKTTQIDAINGEISQIQNEISALESDKRNTVASLVQGKSIPSVELTPLVNQLKKVALDAQVQFQGFNIQNDSITTNLTAVNSDKDAVQKIIVMMNNFAKNGQQGTFALEPILTISGNRETRTTPVTFKIVPIKEEKATENVKENTQENNSENTETK